MTIQWPMPKRKASWRRRRGRQALRQSSSSSSRSRRRSHYERTVNAEEIALVADIGGGTSDFSIVRVSPERATKADRRGDILGCSGVHVGGTDFDRLLSMDSLMPHLGLRSRLKREGMDAPSWYFADLATWHRVNFLYEPKVIAEIKTVRRDSAEPEKIERLLRVVEKRLGHELLEPDRGGQDRARRGADTRACR